MIAERETPAPLALPPAVLLMAGRTAGFVAAFAIPIVLVRVLDQAAFGTYKQLFLVAATLYGVGQLGMAESLFYFLPRAPGDGARYLANAILALGAGGLACLVALAAGGPALARWLGNPELARHATALGVYMLLMLLSAALEIVMISRKRYERAAWLYGALDVVRAGCLLLPVLVAPDVHWLLLGAVGFALLRCGAAAGYFRREFGDALRPDAGLLRRQLAYALPFQLAGMVEIAQVNLHQYAVASAFDPATFAVYAVGCLQVPLVEIVITSVVNVMMVRMAEDLADGRRAAACAVWHDSARKLALLFFPVAVMLFALARPLIAFLFTERYAASAPVFMASTLALLWPVLAVDGVLRVYAATRWLFALGVVRLALTVALLAALVPTLGLVGAMLATVLAAGASRLLGLVRIGTLMALPPSRLLPWRGLIRILAAALGAAAPVLVLRAALEARPLPTLLVEGPVYAVGYLLALRVTGALDADEWRALRAALARLGVGANRTLASAEVNEPCAGSRE